MSKIVFNPNSIFTNSQANFIVNRDAVYRFTTAVSSINNAVWGIQPTPAQYISGVTIDEISANHSLCSDVFWLNNNVDAMKFFAQRPFVKCASIEERDETATNPLAVYLTPIDPVDPEMGISISKRKLMNNLKNLGIWDQVKIFLETNGYWEDFDTATTLDENEEMMQSAIAALKESFGMSDNEVANILLNSAADSESISANDCYEWMFVFDPAVDWDYIKQYADGEHYLSTAYAEGKGSWELIGSTSLTDSKISAMLRDVYETIDAISTDIYTAIDTISTALSTAIDDEVAAREAAVQAEEERATLAEAALNNALTAETQAREDADAALEGLISTVSSDLTDTIDGLSNEFTAFADSTEISVAGLCSEVENLSSGLSGAIDAVSAAHDAFVEETEAAIEDILTAELPALKTDLTNVIDAVSSDLSTQISNEKTRAAGAEAALQTALGEEVEARTTADEGISGVVDAISTDLSNAVDFLSGKVDGLEEDTTEKIDFISGAVDSVSDIVDAEVEFLSGTIDSVSSALSGAIDYLSGAIDDATGGEIGKIEQLSGAIDSVSGAVDSEVERAMQAEEAINRSLSAFALSTVVAEAYALSVGDAEENATDLTSDADEFIYRFYQGGVEVGHINVPQDQFVVSAGFSGTILVLELRGGQTISTDLKDVVDVLTGDSGDETRVSVYINPETNIVSAALLDEYVLQEDFNGFSADVVHGLSNVINPKLAELADAISTEVQRLDTLSGGVDAILTSTLPGLSSELTDMVETISSDLTAETDKISSVLSNYTEKADLCAAIVPTISAFNTYASGAESIDNISAIIEWSKALHAALLSCCGLGLPIV